MSGDRGIIVSKNSIPSSPDIPASPFLFKGASLLLGLVASLAPLAAGAGHEVTFYPSFYPQEFRIEIRDEAQAAALFKKKALAAYLGAEPRLEGQAPAHVKRIESLDSLVLLTINPESERLKAPDERCAQARRLVAALANAPGLVFHPYPVTPFHADHLRHQDRIEAAKAATSARAEANPALAVRAKGGLARTLAEAGWRIADERSDASVDVVEAGRLVAPLGAGSGVWPQPPWGREGWFQAHRLIAPHVSDAEDRRAVEEAFQRLLRGRVNDLSEQAQLERRLTQNLTRGCERLVAGYTVRREAYDDDYSTGVENLAADSLAGMASAVFARTVKLKDFPWNGWLTLAVKERPEAAWNPVAGFTDASGHFVWSMVADQAFLPVPYHAGWAPNRIDIDPAKAVERGRVGRVEVPADALAPDAASGLLKPVGSGKVAAAKVSYKVLASPFEDGSEMEMADLLYPFVVAFRWGASAAAGPGDADVAAATRHLREALVAVKPLAIERSVTMLADIKVPHSYPMLEVYLDRAFLDPSQTAALAPPWSAVPWHLLVLMEEAVSRGFAAFSKGEAARRGVPWLDLARDKETLKRLRALIDEFAKTGHRPPALAERVAAAAATTRWQALGKFLAAHGHLLVTNGPYRLKEWSRDAIVFDVVRELTYPLGLGAFNAYVDPPKAILTSLERKGNLIEARVDAEVAIKSGRRLTTVREPFKADTLRGTYLIRPMSQYILIGPDGSVADAGRARFEPDGRFVVELPAPLPKGRYDFRIGIHLDGNVVGGALGALGVESGG